MTPIKKALNDVEKLLEKVTIVKKQHETMAATSISRELKISAQYHEIRKLENDQSIRTLKRVIEILKKYDNQ